jgi:hypothetical protein
LAALAEVPVFAKPRQLAMIDLLRDLGLCRAQRVFAGSFPPRRYGYQALPATHDLGYAEIRKLELAVMCVALRIS